MPYHDFAEKAFFKAGQGADSLLSPDGIVIAESSRKMLQPMAESYGPLRRYRVLEQGDANLCFYTR